MDEAVSSPQTEVWGYGELQEFGEKSGVIVTFRSSERRLGLWGASCVRGEIWGYAELQEFGEKAGVVMRVMSSDENLRVRKSQR